MINSCATTVQFCVKFWSVYLASDCRHTSLQGMLDCVIKAHLHTHKGAQRDKDRTESPNRAPERYWSWTCWWGICTSIWLGLQPWRLICLGASNCRYQDPDTATAQTVQPSWTWAGGAEESTEVRESLTAESGVGVRAHLCLLGPGCLFLWRQIASLLHQQPVCHTEGEAWGCPAAEMMYAVSDAGEAGDTTTTEQKAAMQKPSLQALNSSAKAVLSPFILSLIPVHSAVVEYSAAVRLQISTSWHTVQNGLQCCSENVPQRDLKHRETNLRESGAQ